MKPRLISYKLCPFSHRVAIVLQHKDVEHEIEYIDYDNPPAWFLELSPSKKVPVLQVDGDAISESSVINEYLDQVYPNKMHPDDPVALAKNRIWIQHGGQCTVNVLHLAAKGTETEFFGTLEELRKNLDQVEPAIQGKPFFNGEVFSLVDATYAPMLQRLGFLDEILPGILDEKRHPKTIAWKDVLVAHPAVQKSSIPKMRELYRKLLWKKHGYLSGFLDKSN